MKTRVKLIAVLIFLGMGSVFAQDLKNKKTHTSHNSSEINLIIN